MLFAGVCRWIARVGTVPKLAYGALQGRMNDEDQTKENMSYRNSL